LQRLLGRLESREFAQREQAEAQIIQLGPAALPLLPTITPQTSGELKLRLQRIRQQLEGQVVEAYFQSSHLTMTATKPLVEMLDGIAEQTENRIRLHADDGILGQLPIEASWEGIPFWEAVQDLMQQAQLRLLPLSSSSGDLVLTTRYSENPVPPAIYGPFRIDVVSVQSERNFESRLDGQLRVGLMLSWEPRMEPLFMQLPMSALVAVDETGNRLAASNPQASPEVRLNVGGSSVRFEVQLEVPTRAAESLNSLSGKLVISVPGDRHQYAFEQLDDGQRQKQEFGDVSVTLEGARKNGPVFETRFFVEFGDSAGALESYRGWVMSNRAYLVDPVGKVLENVGFQSVASSANGVGVSYMFQIAEDPGQYKLIYESPSSIARQTLDFQLNDIPLP
jgi:hypothetical protein